MKSTSKCKNVGFSTILWAVIAILLCIAPCIRADTVPSGNTWNIPTNEHPNPTGLFVNGIANLLKGASVSNYIYVNNGGTLNFYTGAYSFLIQVFSGSHVNLYGGIVSNPVTVYPGANVIVYGDYFLVYGDPTIYKPGNTLTGYKVLTAYEYGSPTDKVLFSGPISCIDPASVILGFLPENEPPVPNAGTDLIVFIQDITSTIINGTATDPDLDALFYRWLEGEVKFTLWNKVVENDEAQLNLGIIEPGYLGIGTHILTLEVTDGLEVVSNEMVLTIIDIVPVDIDIKPGSYPNSVNKNGHGVIPVAILGSADFDVMDIDPTTLNFEGLVLRVKGNGLPQCSIQDVSGDFTNPEGAPDGYPDLVCQFVDYEPTEWLPGITNAEVTGNLKDGTPIAGSGEITVVP